MTDEKEVVEIDGTDFEKHLRLAILSTGISIYTELTGVISSEMITKKRSPKKVLLALRNMIYKRHDELTTALDSLEQNNVTQEEEEKAN